MTLFEQLKPTMAPTDEMLYLASHIRDTATEVIDLDGRGIIAVLVEDEIHVSFVVFSEECGESIVVGTTEPKTPAFYSVVFHGNGPSGALRELRHTYWGDPNNAGYIFYPHGKLIADAFAKLDRWFDCD